MDVSSGYSGMHVAIDAQRYTTVRDYWPIDARAGDRLWITFSTNNAPTQAGAPAAKRVRCEKIRIQCLSARGYQQAKEAAKEPGYAVIAGICVGVVQNRLPADPVYGPVGKKCSFELSSASERKREIHLCLNENVWIESNFIQPEQALARNAPAAPPPPEAAGEGGGEEEEVEEEEVEEGEGGGGGRG